MASQLQDKIKYARFTRRDVIKFGAASLALAGCSRLAGTNQIANRPWPSNPDSDLVAPIAAGGEANPPSSPVAWLAANRLMFGPREGDLGHIDKIGIDAFVEEQLGLDEYADEGVEVKGRLAGLDVMSLSAAGLFDKYDKMRGPIVQQLATMATMRAIYSKRQLYEVMVDFWTNHFNIFALKDRTTFLKPVDDREVIRPHALGNFRDLLGASMHSPAMLFYLDNQANRKGQPDENYARELLELHTLGVNGGYAESDVHELARALSGWGMTGLGGATMLQAAGEFKFNANQHDDGAKVILGVSFPSKGGVKDIEQMLDILANHPSTAKFIATKLARRFISDDPPASAIMKGADAFTKSRGDIKTTVGAVLHGMEFQSSFGHKLKRPLEYIASIARALDADVTWSDQLGNAFRQMGQPLFLWAPPNGFPDFNNAWIESSSLLARWNFALGVSAGTFKGFGFDAKKLPALVNRSGIDSLSRHLLNADLPAVVKEKLMPFAGESQVSLLIGLMLASPLYQVRG